MPTKKTTKKQTAKPEPEQKDDAPNFLTELGITRERMDEAMGRLLMVMAVSDIQYNSDFIKEIVKIAKDPTEAAAITYVATTTLLKDNE